MYWESVVYLPRLWKMKQWMKIEMIIQNDMISNFQGPQGFWKHKDKGWKVCTTKFSNENCLPPGKSKDDWSFISNDQKHFSVYMILFWCRNVIIQWSIAMFVPTFTFQRENRAIYLSSYDH